MTSTIDKCLELVNLCSHDEKKELLKILKILTNDDNNQGSVISDNPNNSAKPTTPDNPEYEKFVSYHSSFLGDESFLEQLRLELDSMDLYRTTSRKPLSQWLSCNDNTMSKYPYISKLLDLVNKHSNMKSGDLDCCHVTCYSNDRKTLRLHSDNEPTISQSHPIATFSIGATRKIDFVPTGASHTRVAHTINAESNSLYIMYPGCQTLLQHRVLPGSTAAGDSQVRYSLSFRKHIPLLDTTVIVDPNSSPVSMNSPSKSPIRYTPATLLLGDSFPARLDETKLGKSKKVVLNRAKGGNKIPDVLLSIDDFCSNANNHQYKINQVFVSVGTNDIRYCRNGVSHLKGELFSLVRKIKQSFPNAKLFLQSLLPLPITYSNKRYIIRNVCDFNRIVYHVCSHEKVHMLNVFSSFLYNGYRNPALFPLTPYDIHPNSRGIGILAKFYIDRIHGRRFDPLSPN